MKSIRFVLALLAAGLLFPACSPFLKIYSETAPGANLYRYRSYDWLNTGPVKHGNSGPTWLNARAENKIRSAVESRMSSYGFKPCDERPDLMLHFHVVIENKIYYEPDAWCDEVQRTGLGKCHRLKPVHYREGTLLIDFIDAQTGEQVWRGVAVGVLENLKPEAADARIEEAVRLIFKRFPEKPAPGA